MITWYVNCCAKCNFHPFLPFSSITMPPSCKMLLMAKTPENSTLWAYSLILPAYDTKRSHFRYYRTKIRKLQIRIDGAIFNCSTLHITCIVFFSKHHLPLPVNPIYYHLLNYPYYTNCYNISYSIQLYRYYNTVIAM